MDSHCRSLTIGGTFVFFVLLQPGCKDDFKTSTDAATDGLPADATTEVKPSVDVHSGALKAFGDSCSDSAKCKSRICIKSCSGSACSKKCTPAAASACPSGYGCVGVNGALEPGKVDYVCVRRCDGGVADQKLADKTKPDTSQPDAPIPDAMAPDVKAPDATVPDAPNPDKAVVLKQVEDVTFSDFSKGTFSESGAKIYASAKGNVQMIERFDFNNDGHMDLLIPNLGVTTYVSYVYWGSKVGFTSTALKKLPTTWAESAATADFNDDGYVDIAIGSRTNGVGNQSTARLEIFWGSTSGYSSSNKNTFTIGASVHGLAVGDLNRDGYLDLVVPRRYNGKSFQINSYVYWGSKNKISQSSRLELPTLGGNGAAIADLNSDGHLDLVFANTSNGTTSAVNSYIYWGSTTGFASSNRAELPTVAANDVAIADLNKDGYLDLAIANHHSDGPKFEINSFIYWGSSAGYSVKSRVVLPTIGANDVAVSDLNSDGYLDIMFSNQRATTSSTSVFEINSYVYWGSKTGYTATNRLELPVLGAEASFLADLDLDGYVDITVANVGITGKMNSYIYHGSASGFSTSKRTELPCLHAEVANAHNSPGSVWTRGMEQSFVSRIFDTGSPKAIYKSLTWSSQLPAGTTMKLLLRSGATPITITSTLWRGPSSTAKSYKVPGAINNTHNGHRYIQYRAVFTSDYRSTPKIDKVTISYY